jgi:hypothetical protein
MEFLSLTTAGQCGLSVRGNPDAAAGGSNERLVTQFAGAIDGAGDLRLHLSARAGHFRSHCRARDRRGAGQQTAQREIIAALGTALDARRQRIIISQAEVNPVKWWCLYLQAICELLAIALIHCDNRLASGIALMLFATGVAASVLLIAAHDRPFTGQISIGPEPLRQIMPGTSTSR